MTKRKVSAYQLPQVPAPAERISVCVPVPDEPAHIRAFLGQLDALSYWWTWDRDPAKTGTVAARQWLEIAREVRESIESAAGCGTMEFRQNPADKCQLQYRQRAGDPWQLMFDFGLCTPPSLSLALAGIANQTAIASTAAGSITNININAPVISFRYQAGSTPAENVNRDGALCYAIKVYVQLAKQAIEQEIAGAITGINLVNLAGAAVIGIASALVSGGVLFGVGMAIWSGVFGLGAAILGNNAEQVLLDPQAELDVRCLMYERLKNAETNVQSFQDALRPAALTGNSELLRQAIYGLMNTRTDEQFRAFVNLIANADNGNTDGECICPETCEFWDFKYGGAELGTIDPALSNAPNGILGLKTDLGYQSVRDQRADRQFTSLQFVIYFPSPISISEINWHSSAQTVVNGGERVVFTFLDANMNQIGQTGQVAPTFPALDTIYLRSLPFPVPPTGVSAIRYDANGGTNSFAQKFTVHDIEVCSP